MSWLSFVISVARVVEQMPNHQSIAGLIAEPYTLHFVVFLKNTTKIGAATGLQMRQQLSLKT